MGGTGTQTDPYLVATAEQFDAIRQDMDAHYKLVADIDLTKPEVIEDAIADFAATVEQFRALYEAE